MVLCSIHIVTMFGDLGVTRHLSVRLTYRLSGNVLNFF